MILGIDPGGSGAFALYAPGILQIDDMPTFNMTVGKTTRKRVDAPGVADLIETYKMMGLELAVLEAVGGRPRQSASAAFVFGYSTGLVYMALINARIPVETVPPQTWKKLMKMPGKRKKGGAGADKEYLDAIKVRATEILPDAGPLFYGPRGGARVDRMEAACMAVFGYRHMLGNGQRQTDVEGSHVYQRNDLGA